MADLVGNFEVGKDVVLKEKEVMKELLTKLPRKAQLGFSTIRDQLAHKGEHGFRRLFNSARPHDAVKLEYTCLDISKFYVALGCNLGLLFLYDRERNRLNRFVCEVKHVPVTATKILESTNFVAAGQYNGNLTIFHYATEKSGVTKPLLKCTVEAHHVAPVTAIQWTPDGTKVFTGDSEGHVAITVINMDEGQTHTVNICNEESPVVQLAFSHTALLISTLRRSLIWPFNTKTPVQLGQQERKVYGNFGACFFPTAKEVPSELQPIIYASRPGLRMWKATMEGKVMVTMFFKESVSQGEPEIYTINLPSKGVSACPTEQRQFGTVEVLDDSYLVSFQGSCLWVIDPIFGRLIGCHGNLGLVVDIAVLKNEIFVLTKEEGHFLRRITLRTRAESPIIQVKELNLVDDDVENEENAIRSSSISQFAENDKLERLIDDVGNTMVGIISGVKSTVVKTIGQITKDDSEEERSDGGYGTSGSYSSPQTLLRSLNTKPQLHNGCLSTSPFSNQSSLKMVNTLESCLTEDDNLNEVAGIEAIVCDNQTPEEEVNFIIEHRSREYEAPFQHLVQQEYPSEIVYEGTSKGVPVSKRKRKKRKKLTENTLKDGPKISKSEEDNSIGKSNLDGSEETAPVTESNSLPSSSLAEHEAPLIVDSINFKPEQEDADASNLKIDKTTDFFEYATMSIGDEAQTDVDVYLETQKDIAKVEGEEVDENSHEKVLSTSLSDSLTSFSSGSTDMSSELDGMVENDNAETNIINVQKEVKNESYEFGTSTTKSMHSKEEVPTTENSDELKKGMTSSETSGEAGDSVDLVVSEIKLADASELFLKETEFKTAGEVSIKTESDVKTCVENAQVSKKRHKKVHSLSALIDFQQELHRKEQELIDDKDILTLREKVQQTFRRSDDHSFKPLSCSMDGINVTSRMPLFTPTLGLAYRSDIKSNRVSSDGLRSHRHVSCSSNNSLPCSEQGNNVEPDDQILNIEISTQESYLEKSTSSECCKKIDGEAVERIRSLPRHISCSDEDDSLFGNLVRLDDEEERVQVDESPRIKAPTQPSAFPPPQISTLTSIYSQETVSLSDLLSEPSLPGSDDDIKGNFYSVDQDVNSSALASIESDEVCYSGGRDTPPVNLDTFGGEEMTDMAFTSKQNESDNVSEHFTHIGELDSEGKKDCATELSSSVHADLVSERLRLLADSWAEVSLPSCGQVQSLMVTDTLAWCIDNHDHIFYSQSASLIVNWKKLDGRARMISSNQKGTVVWAVCRKRCAYYRTNVKEGNPQGSDWEPVEKDVLCVTVDDTGVWGIKMNGDVFVRPDVSSSFPQGKSWRTIRVASDLVQISCVDGVVWALDIYNHVQVYHVEPESLYDNGQVVMWKELPGISASYVRLGPKGVCWIIDRDGGVWFNLEVSLEKPFGGDWYQLSWSDSFVHDTSLMSSMASYFKQNHEPKSLTASDSAGVWVLSKYGKIRVSRGHLLGTRWELKVPSGVSTSACWTCVSALGCRIDREYIWALQPNGKLHCFNSDGRDFVVPSPPKTVLKYISASRNSVWALTSGSDVYIRRGICTACPQGAKWTKVDMTSQGQEKLCHISAGNLVVWAVDYKGNVWFQMGKEEQRHNKTSPAWLQVEGCPFDGCHFTKIVVGADDLRVWAVDDRNNVYARKDVTDNFLIGVTWEVIPGTGAKDIAISEDLVWALCPNGDIISRYGVTSKNFMGDYWKKAPGLFDHISVGIDNELWGIDRQGHLYQRQTIHFFGAQSTKKAPSYSHLFETDDDWELI